MEAIDVGWLSLLPPVIAIVFAFITKEVITSLIIGILAGTLVYALNTGGGLVTAIDLTMNLMTIKIGDNASIIIFLALLGALVTVITMAGGTKAYGEWAITKIKTKRGAQLSTSFLGLLIFIDDYFNCLTVGTVMRPVTDKYKISRAKLAYIIDATAAPICIIMPVSSWAASVISQLDDVGLSGMDTFLALIPYNFYAILTIIMVLILCVTDLDFGPMQKFELLAQDGNDITNKDKTNTEELVISDKGTVLDLLIPIGALILFCVLAMLYVGGYFEGGMTISEGFGNTDAGIALALGGFTALVATMFLFVPRGIMTLQEFMEGVTQGVKSMVPAFIILTLAWTISGVCRDLLGTGEFVGAVAEASNLPAQLIPAIVFVVAAFLAAATGTSWGTFGILIPIVAVIMIEIAPSLMIISLSATLAGAVLGDHCSPISDTTILSSAGANCGHLDHISTQVPYVILVGCCSMIGYLVAGFTENLLLSFGVSLIALLVALFSLHKFNLKNRY
ncbi:MAG: sodium:proton antiporter [Epulopiscium sp. Nele67-Bin004]|nr:MAG: sodium:proton antiporter [Epulopiscium sp. Nele67-Bin004]